MQAAIFLIDRLVSHRLGIVVTAQPTLQAQQSRAGRYVLTAIDARVVKPGWRCSIRETALDGPSQADPELMVRAPDNRSKDHYGLCEKRVRKKRAEIPE